MVKIEFHTLLNCIHPAITNTNGPTLSSIEWCHNLMQSQVAAISVRCVPTRVRKYSRVNYDRFWHGGHCEFECTLHHQRWSSSSVDWLMGLTNELLSSGGSRPVKYLSSDLTLSNSSWSALIGNPILLRNNCGFSTHQLGPALKGCRSFWFRANWIPPPVGWNVFDSVCQLIWHWRCCQTGGIKETDN